MKTLMGCIAEFGQQGSGVGRAAAKRSARIAAGKAFFPLLAILSYSVLIRAEIAHAATAIPASAAKPLVRFKNRQTVTFTYTGAAAAVAALRSGKANPTSLAEADFDADGAIDVVAGYSTTGGGVVALLRGNPDAYAPKNLSLYKKAMQGSVPATFLSKARVVEIPESPDFLATGDFNRDGHPDVLAAARDGGLYFLAGDGRGGLRTPEAVALPGRVEAMAATPDGHVALSLDGPRGAQLVILSPSPAGLSTGATYTLPAQGAAVAWGGLGGRGDLAVGAGSHVVMIYNALGPNPQTETVAVPFQVAGLAVGNFIWDRDDRTEVSVLASDGTIHILQHGTLDTTPLTAADIPGRRAALRAKMKSKQAPNPTALGTWTEAKQLPDAGSATSRALAPSEFNSPRLAAAATQDLMVLDAGRRELNILDTSGKASSPTAALAFSDTPVAALALPQKINAGRDLVVLTAGQAALTLIPAVPDPTFTVSTTADTDAVGACTSTSITTAPDPLSLREAICVANNNAPAASTIYIGPGTYELTSLETGELQVNANGTGYSLSIIGTGTAANTIIEQTDGVDRILEEDYALSGGNPVSISNVTLTQGNCTTGVDCGFGGGAIIAGGIAGDDLSLTNVVMTNNTDNSTVGELTHNGGAVADQGPNLTLANSSFSTNTAPGQQGGAVWYQEAVVTQGAEVITNSTFTGNTSGQGGALLVEPYVDAQLSFLGYATISGSTFTGNTANGSQTYGGAIYAEAYDGTITVSNSRFANNTAEYGSGFALENMTTGIATDNWWGCNAGPGAPANDGPSEGSGGTGSPINPGVPNVGCDTLYTDTFNSAVLTFDPWLVLGISASPTQILSNGTSSLTADLTHDSNGGSGFSVPDGTSVAFGATLGSDSPTSTSTTSGQATSTFTAGGTGGAGSATAKVDSQTVSVAISIQATTSTSVGSSLNPSMVGQQVTFTATVSGSSPTGTVGFTSNSIGITGCSMVALAAGTAQCMTSGLASGTDSIVATYSGDSNNQGSTSTGYPQMVQTLSYTVTPGSLAFGSETIHVASSSQPVTVTNTGTAALPITSITISGQNPAQFSQTNNCGSSVGVNTSCTINVVFQPNGKGSMRATLNVNGGGGTGTQTVGLSGTGGAAPYTVSPTSIAFGNETVRVASSPHIITVTNTGATALAITSITLTSPDPYPYPYSQTNNCGSSVPVSAFCTINVVFDPDVPGLKVATVNINAGGGAGTQTVSLTGTAVAVPYTVAPKSLVFASQPHGTASASQPVTVTNTGSAAVPITSITLGGRNAHQFSQSNNCGNSIAVSTACTINVEFTPTAVGSMNATLSVNAGNGDSTQTVTLSGTGS